MWKNSTCPICKSSRKEFFLKDWQGNSYFECIDCNITFQDAKEESSYNENYWVSNVDPDGKKRDIRKERDFKIRNWHGEVINVLNSMKPRKILDIGSGLGFFLSAVNEKWDRYGIEHSQFAVDFARKNFKGIEFAVSSIEDYKGNECFYDVVHMYHVIEHLDDPKEAIKKANRILKRGGFLILGTPNIESFCAKRFKGNFRLLDKGHKVLFSSQAIRKIIENNGFSVKKITYPYFKTDYFNAKNILRLFNTSKLSPPFWGNIMNVYATKK